MKRRPGGAKAEEVKLNDPRVAAALRCSFLLCAFLLCGGAAIGLPATDPSQELTLEQFRSLVADRLAAAATTPAKSRAKASPAPDLRAADEAFSSMLTAQAKEDATRQSMDRLSGWRKAIEARGQIQNAPALDVDMIRFAEALSSAEADQYQAERQRATQQANALLGRPADSPLTALISSSQAPPAVADANVSPALGKLEKEILPQGHELLGKLYQSYMFGGVPLSSLLWQEQQLYHAEMDYRLGVVRQAMSSITSMPSTTSMTPTAPVPQQ